MPRDGQQNPPTTGQPSISPPADQNHDAGRGSGPRPWAPMHVEYSRRLRLSGIRLTGAERDMLDALLEHVHFRTYRETGQLIAWPSQKTIIGGEWIEDEEAAKRGIKKRKLVDPSTGGPSKWHPGTISRATKGLIEKKLIRTWRVGRGWNKSTGYEILWPPPPQFNTSAGASIDLALAQTQSQRRRAGNPSAGAGLSASDASALSEGSEQAAAAAAVELTADQKACVGALARSGEFSERDAEQVVRGRPPRRLGVGTWPHFDGGRLQRICDDVHRQGATVSDPAGLILHKWAKGHDPAPMLFTGKEFNPLREPTGVNRDGSGPVDRLVKAIRGGRILCARSPEGLEYSELKLKKFGNHHVIITAKGPDAQLAEPTIADSQFDKWKFIER